MCNGQIQLFAFEPIPDIRACTVRNLESWDTIHVLPYGVSHKKGTASFTFYPNAPSLSTAKNEDWDHQDGAFEEAVAGNTRHAPMWYARLVPRFLAGPIAKYLRKDTVEVHCELVTLSHVIEDYSVDRIDLLKIDCEGAEEDALLGLKEDHWTRINQAVIEVHDIDGRLNRIIELLRKHGLTEQVVEKEDALENTLLTNVYAHRPR